MVKMTKKFAKKEELVGIMLNYSNEKKGGC
jgi:hypothetical protein